MLEMKSLMVETIQSDSTSLGILCGLGMGADFAKWQRRLS